MPYQFDELVSLRQFWHAVSIGTGFSDGMTAAIVEDFLNANNFSVDVYYLEGPIFSKIDEEERWESGVNVSNEIQGDFLALQDPVQWLQYGRAGDKYADWTGIEKIAAAKLPVFSSITKFERCLDQANLFLKSRELRNAQFAIDHLLDLLREEEESYQRPIYNTGLMKIAIKVQREYWSDNNQTPKQEVIIREIRTKHNLTEAQAKAVERVACPITR